MNCGKLIHVHHAVRNGPKQDVSEEILGDTLPDNAAQVGKVFFIAPAKAGKEQP